MVENFQSTKYPSFGLTLYSFFLLTVVFLYIDQDNVSVGRSGLLILVICFFLDRCCRATFNLVSLVFPVILTIHNIVVGSKINAVQIYLFMLITLWMIGVSMSVCLHRYFSHRAFQTTRAMQFVLGIISCLAYQGGPLFWAMQHLRHHKHCDQEGDPHSVTKDGFLYAFIGWMMNPSSYEDNNMDYSSLPDSYFVPEMISVEIFHMAPPILLCVIVTYNYGYDVMIRMVLCPMLTCRLITLLFNVEFHPYKHTTKKCNAIDDDRVLAKLVGESRHSDHHAHPRKSKRPDWDLPYLFFILPLKSLGLIWNCQ